jgi:hypothetical protein
LTKKLSLYETADDHVGAASECLFVLRDYEQIVEVGGETYAIATGPSRTGRNIMVKISGQSDIPHGRPELEQSTLPREL